MIDQPIALIAPPAGYADWLCDLKQRINSAQQRAALAVNRELILLYWQIGHDILVRQTEQGWGSKVIERLGHDLRLAFPKANGFSPRNLKYMRAFAEAWPEPSFVQQVVAQLPWGHQLRLLEKLSEHSARVWYVNQAIQHNWSRSVLVANIEAKLLERSGTAITNFDLRLPKAHSDLARETLKDPYRFDFLAVGREASERELEEGLVKHATDFLLELGAGFAFVGRQVLINVAGEDFFIDLLFYHLHLRCYVVLELKAGKFKPEHLGQLGFYLTAVNQQMKRADDNPTLGLLLCKERNKVVAEYALGDNVQPMGVAEYSVLGPLPEALQTRLPSIEQIEKELADGPGWGGGTPTSPCHSDDAYSLHSSIRGDSP